MTGQHQIPRLGSHHDKENAHPEAGSSIYRLMFRHRIQTIIASCNSVLCDGTTGLVDSNCDTAIATVISICEKQLDDLKSSFGEVEGEIALSIPT